MNDALPSYSFKCPYCDNGYIDIPFFYTKYGMCDNCGKTVEFEIAFEDADGTSASILKVKMVDGNT